MKRPMHWIKTRVKGALKDASLKKKQRQFLLMLMVIVVILEGKFLK